MEGNLDCFRPQRAPIVLSLHVSRFREIKKIIITPMFKMGCQPMAFKV